MPIVISGSDFTPAPEGIFAAVCVDVVDLGVVESSFGKKHMIKVVWEIDAKMEDGRPFTVQRRYSASLHEKSSLAKDLKGWRGKAFTPDELKGFDIEKVLGAPCTLVISHTEKEGGVFANVQAISKAGDKRLAPSGKYVRAKDRPKDQQFSNGNGGSKPREPGQDDDDDRIPF